MLTGEEAMEIRVLMRQGMSIRSIARTLGMSRNTVRKYVREAGEPGYGPRQARGSKLDEYKSYLVDRVQAAKPHFLPATVLLREVQEMGYEGGLTILREFMSSLRPQHEPEPLIRFETAPGEQMQVDYCCLRPGKHRLSAFVAVLGYCRAAFVRFVFDERLETLLDCHEQAFAFFGGVPRRVLYDNMKTVVIERDGYGPGLHRFQPQFKDFVEHYGFQPRLCRPYRAKTKGKVERFNHYLRYSFAYPLVTRLKQAGLVLDIATANVEVGIWLRDVANMRTHGTTGESPTELLRQERPFLMTPPPWKVQTKPQVFCLSQESFRPLQRSLEAYERFSRPVQQEAQQ